MDGSGEITGEMLGDQMDDDLGVGFGVKCMSFGTEFFFQGEIIFDDAIMDENEPCGFMGMRIKLGDAPMRRPAGMADADRARRRIAPHYAFEVF
jgi:hypothetical protein